MQRVALHLIIAINKLTSVNTDIQICYLCIIWILYLNGGTELLQRVTLSSINASIQHHINTLINIMLQLLVRLVTLSVVSIGI